MEQLFDIVEMIKIIILSIIQGITEWLPVSSTGHLLLFDNLVPLNLRPEFINMFMVLVQLASIIAVIIVFFNKLNPLDPNKTAKERQDTWVLWLKVAVASVPAALFGLALDDLIESKLSTPFVIALTLIIYGILFIWVESKESGNHARKIKSFKDLKFRHAFYMGLFQALALIPGTSRSGATIIGGLLMGASRFIAAEFSFFMSIPVMFGASLLKLVKFGFDFTVPEIFYLITGMLVSFIVSVLAIKFLLDYIKRHDFKIFGYYRIGLGILVILYFYILNPLF
ncbi:undecaprenyl-diphosphate phosphatase [Dolosicoccus paucivorans]|uniref:Undecaprenyl-diphosphatase n=1 Tax=Dolosicoccus paucivorans TaxID=84521 RepID=A0A1G8JQ62_9LACT|nr:undecaprenyl-diphosphate phosphatase [Dolosicoccus paucivorans]PMB84110.1 undecaprenyl-diphosphate phosphatase [Dolosicoccus paucivorans]PMC58358.1 undecaprenyl-diphosphate phosphatase [Dolosicoccus paucivorans]SDI33157.1 Undecaprenyl-diphosphatase [Dolosicoccus paucivorans]